MSETMHGSSTGFRSRQRTFTSCTECRRRKQKCNQAKDRPCSNCARRYPPPVCTYESSSPTPPPRDQVMDFGNIDRQRARLNQPDHMNETANPAIMHASQYYNGSTQTAHNAPSIYHSVPPTTRSDDQVYQGGTYGNQQAIVSAPGRGDPHTLAGGYYASDHMSYNTAESSDGIGCYSAADQQEWLTSGDPDVFVGTGTTEYFYVDEPEPSRSNGGRQ